MNPTTPVGHPQIQQKISSIDNPDKYTVVYNWMSLNQAKAKWNDPKTDKTDFAFLKTFIDLRTSLSWTSNYIVDRQRSPQARAGEDPSRQDRRNQRTRQTRSAMAPTSSGWKHGVQMDLVANPNYNLTAPAPLSSTLSRSSTPT